MRFLTAAILFVVSAALILTGLAERTIWHPPASHVQLIKANNRAPLMVVEHSVLTQFPGQPVVTASNDGSSFIATGRQSDVDAWVGATTHQIVGVRHSGDSATHVAIRHGSQISANPLGSDLWRHEVSAIGNVSTLVDPSDGAALLVASNGFNPAPQNLKITWAIEFDPTPSRILFLVGGILLLTAVIVNWWAWYQMRKDRGPRRRTPRAPQGPKLRRRRTRATAPVRGRRSARNFTATAAGLLITASLAGCSTAQSSASVTPSTDASNLQQPAVVTEPQLKNIVGRVSQVVAAGDSVHDSKQLTTRVDGPALDTRSSYYALQKASKSIQDLPAIATSRLNLALPAASGEWPRSVMVITSTGANDHLPQMLVLQQQSPRAQYKLWYDIDMLPGVKLPVLNTAKTGAIPVAADSLFLKIAPQALPTAFGDLIDNGSSSLSASMFNVANDEYYKQIAASVQSQQQNLNNATIKVVHLLGDPNVLSLSTVNSGALVAVYMQDKYVIKPKDRTQAVAVSGNEKLLLGSSGSATGIKSFYGSMLLFYVPAIASKDRIVTLGATQVLLKVTSL
jgi:hypothetical protein